MSAAIKKFVDRAPRYVLRGSDEKIFRYTLSPESTEVFTTTFVNFSLSGIAFLANYRLAPKMGDVIKIEFPVPGAEKIAWWGTVVRTERYRPGRGWHLKNDFKINEDLLIAVRFENLPTGHQSSIQFGLRAKADELAKIKRAQYKLSVIEFLKKYFWQIIAFGLCAALTFSALYILSQPSDNYDAIRGSPWGQRFKF